MTERIETEREELADVEKMKAHFEEHSPFNPTEATTALDRARNLLGRLPTDEVSWLRKSAVYLEAGGFPTCMECMTTRDLFSCDECSSQGEGMAAYCRSCFQNHDGDEPTIIEKNGTPVPEDLRFKVDEEFQAEAIMDSLGLPYCVACTGTRELRFCDRCDHDEMQRIVWCFNCALVEHMMADHFSPFSERNEPGLGLASIVPESFRFVTEVDGVIDGVK